MSESHETEQSLTREEAATALRDVADAVAAGSLVVESDGESTAVEVPETVAFELEVEREDGTRELEIELEWPESPATDSERATEETDSEDTAGDTDPERTTEVDNGSAASAAADDESADQSDGKPAESVDDSASPTVSPGEPSQQSARFELFRDRREEWRWRLRHRNGNVIATSGEGYTQKHNARKGLRSVMQNAPDAETVEEPDR